MTRTLVFTFMILLAAVARAQAPAVAPQSAQPTAVVNAPSSTEGASSAASTGVEEATTTTVQQGAVNAPKPVVLSFVEWKSLRVHEAQQKLEQSTKSQANGQPSTAEKLVTVDKSMEQKLNFNVDVALQLNIQDYFSMYLKNLSKDEFKEATKKMNQEEATELLMAYKASQETSKPTTFKYSKSEKR